MNIIILAAALLSLVNGALEEPNDHALVRVGEFQVTDSKLSGYLKLTGDSTGIAPSVVGDIKFVLQVTQEIADDWTKIVTSDKRNDEINNSLDWLVQAVKNVLTPHKLKGIPRNWTEKLECDVSGKISGKVFLELPTKSWGDVTYGNCDYVSALMNTLFHHPVNGRLERKQIGLKYLLRHSFSRAM